MYGFSKRCRSRSRFYANKLNSHTISPLILTTHEESAQWEVEAAGKVVPQELIAPNCSIGRNDEKMDSLKRSSNDESDLSAECQMKNIIHHLQSLTAVPEYALSEEVFNVDKPLEAVRLGTELHIKTLSQEHKVGNKLLITITEIYSPFQFWFQETDDAVMLREMSHQMYNLYSETNPSRWMLRPHFKKSGYICAAYHDCVWKRARIMKVLSSKELILYFVDYGQCAQLPANKLNFLHQQFMQQPAMVMRGTLTDVYPLDLHWPRNATDHFKRLVRDRDLYAIIKDNDMEERILFVDLYEKLDLQHSISEQLIAARLAGCSRNYSPEAIKANNGRRPRYIRERLPSFDMLELQLFDADSDNWEEKFDEIIYNPQFSRHFEAPKFANPFRRDLEEALAKWLEKFKRMKNL